MTRKDEDSDYSLSITPAAYVASSNEWILDTRAIYHLCPIKEWFTDFHNLESDAVVMGNDQPCRTMGIYSWKWNYVLTLRFWLNCLRLLEQSQKNRKDPKFGGKKQVWLTVRSIKYNLLQLLKLLSNQIWVCTLYAELCPKVVRVMSNAIAYLRKKKKSFV